MIHYHANFYSSIYFFKIEPLIISVNYKHNL